jgi:hypothetical protein
MHEVTWIPSELIDEVNPLSRPSPDDWVVSLDDGAPALHDGGEGEGNRLLKDGEIVGFVTITDYGSAQLIIRSATDWTATPPMPQEAKEVCAISGWQLDSFASSTEECVQNILADEQGEPGEYELSYFTWSNDIPHRFDAKTRTFKPAEPSNG